MYVMRVLVALTIGLACACGQGDGKKEGPPAAADAKAPEVDAKAAGADAGPFDLAKECARLGTMAEAEGLIPPHLVPRNVETCNRDIAALEAASPAEYAKQTRCLTDARDYVAAQSCSEQATMALQRFGK